MGYIVCMALLQHGGFWGPKSGHLSAFFEENVHTFMFECVTNYKHVPKFRFLVPVL